MKKRINYAIAAIILLFGLGLALDFGISKEGHLETYANRIERSLHKKESEINTFLSDTGFIFRQLRGIEKLPSPQQQTDLKHLLDMTKKDYNIRLYKGDSLLYWLNNRAFLTSEQVAGIEQRAENHSLLQLPNGYFHLMKSKLPDGVTALSMIPIKREFSRESEFLPNDFITDDFSIPPDVFLSITPTDFPIHALNGKAIAYLGANGPAKDRFLLQLVFFIYVLGFIAAGVLTNDIAVLLVRQYKPWVGAAFVLGMVIVARSMIIHFGFTQHFASFQTFSEVFTEPILEGVSSLGELLINIILLVWMMVFFNREFEVEEFSNPSKPIKLTLTLLNFFAINLGILMVCHIFKSIVLDSSIVFDFENVFNLNMQSVLAMVGVVLLLLALFLFSHRMMLAIHKIGLPKYWRLGVLVVSILLSLPVLTHGEFNLPLPYFLVAATIYLLAFEFFLEVRSLTLEWMVTWLMLFSALTAMLLYKYNNDKDYIRRAEYAVALTNFQDSIAEENLAKLGETMLSEGGTHRWELLAKYFAPGPAPKEEARSIVDAEVGRSKYLLYNYSFKIAGFYREEGKLAFTEQGKQLGKLVTAFHLATPTKVPFLRFQPEKSEDPGYMLRLELKTEPPIVAFLMFKRSFSSPSKVYTELLLDKKYKDLTELDNYDYGIYRNGILVEERNQPYGKQLTDPLPPVGEFSVVKHTSTRSELLYHAPNGIVIKIGREVGGYIKPLSLFSYVFTLLTLAVLIFAGINYYTDALPGPLNFLRSTKPSLRNQFQFWVIGLILFSFLGIGFVTVWYFQESSNNYHKGRLDRKVTSALASVEYEIKAWHREQLREWEMEKLQGEETAGENVELEFRIMDESEGFQPSRFDKKPNTFSLASLIPLISEVHRLDVNIYDIKGNLITSSEEDIFKGGLVSTKMGAHAFQAITKLGYERSDQDESIGKLEYTAAYLPLKDIGGRTLAFIGIPYYSHHRELSRDVTDFMSTLLNVYVFLLLIAGGLAIFVANSITKALSELRESLSGLGLGSRSNQQLVYKRQDEIGELVSAYNAAVKQIEESSRLLAQSERDSAWREMAKQVAHEIKNPLTPMKLSIQYLLHAYQSNPDNAEPLLKRVSKTLVEQIESLANIATEFSNFAKMPKPENIQFSINDLAASVHHLFANERHDMDISIQLPDKEFEVYADRNHLTRVLNNLFKNAIQAIPDDRKGIISLAIYRENQTVMLRLKDNGTGIPDDIQKKVFTPNFSTKTSGTGLGLAICKSIVEGFGGDIRFETMEAVGTTFYVELPLVKVNELEEA